MEVVAIAAIGRNRELGKGNELLWHIPDDLKRFKELSIGHPIILGRKTFESIVKMLGKPLPGRTNIVISRSARYNKANPLLFLSEYQCKNVILVDSIEEALEKAKLAPGSDKVIIGGGAQIYTSALPYTDTLHLTLIDDSKDADSFFPEYKSDFNNVTYEERRLWNGLNYVWQDVRR